MIFNKKKYLKKVFPYKTVKNSIRCHMLLNNFKTIIQKNYESPFSPGMLTTLAYTTITHILYKNKVWFCVTCLTTYYLLKEVISSVW